MDTLKAIKEKYQLLGGILDERGRRIWAAVEARSHPHGGITLVAKATGLSRTTIHAGSKDLEEGQSVARPTGRVRQRGAGRKLLTHHAPDIVQALDALVEPSSRGAPESLLRWTCKSTRRLAQELQRQGYNIGDRKVADLLRQLNYSLQANAKTLEGRQHPDRNAQFEYINTLSKRFYRRCQPVISVDTKKKELVGDFKNAGREWQPQGQPEETRVHDFMQGFGQGHSLQGMRSGR
jgi:hypothetical protein